MTRASNLASEARKYRYQLAQAVSTGARQCPRVYVRLAAEVLADTRAGAGPLEYEGLREVHLEEVEFRGKENRKFQYAVLCSASLAGGLEPDLLDEVVWWCTDDFWRYALLATVALVRASAVARQLPVSDIVAELAHRRSVTL